MTSAPFHLVLVEPEIPPNTGNVARLCGATGTILHLVGKLGFSLDDKHLKRAGLDYWPVIAVRRWESLDQMWAAFPGASCWFTSKNAARCYTAATFRPGDFLVFGRETCGLPPQLLAAHPERAIRIPILVPEVRSLNLSTAAGIVLYEALRQTGRLA